MKNRKSFLGNILKFSLFVLLIFSSVVRLKASGTDSLFTSDELIIMELKADFVKIQADRTGDPQYHESELIYYSANGEAVKLSVRLMVRGNFRRDTANCDFPPLFVNFRKSEVKNTVFKNQNEIKLVTPCRNDRDVIDEYLIYKMYNKVTDLSMKVRLVKINYYDTGISKKLFERYSFFLEKEGRAAARNNCVVTDIKVTPSDLDREYFKKMSVFQYLIGNHDWYFRLMFGDGGLPLKLNQNIVLMQPEDSTSLLYPVPYDFDLSSFVNADYARSKLIKRTYKGLCLTPAEFKEVFDFYRGLRPEFESLINNAELLTRISRKNMVNYLNDFYAIIGDDKMIKREFLDVCENNLDLKLRTE